MGPGVADGRREPRTRAPGRTDGLRGGQKWNHRGGRSGATAWGRILIVEARASVGRRGGERAPRAAVSLLSVAYGERSTNPPLAVRPVESSLAFTVLRPSGVGGPGRTGSSKTPSWVTSAWDYGRGTGRVADLDR